MGDIVKYYFSLQYSAIQKTVLRHDRLWSISGMSQILAQMNEIVMPYLVQGGNVLVAGGGKFTARFYSKEAGEKARNEIIKRISTNLPMLEFQASIIVDALKWEDAKDAVLDCLNSQKKEFRGYGVSYNPHFRVCPECGEYPAIKRPEDTNKNKDDEDDTEDFCHICFVARKKAIIHKNKLEKAEKLTTLERIYKKYFELYDFKNIPKIPLDFKNLYSDKEEKGLRMAVWFSDLNNMKEKVSIWLSEPEDEDTKEPDKLKVPKIFKIFEMIKDVNIEVISNALIKTFGYIDLKHLPFRLIVAGGDDLRIVMAEEYIFDFLLNYASAVDAKAKEMEDIDIIPGAGYKNDKGKYIYLNMEWLQCKSNEWARKKGKEVQVIKPYSFGGSFVVTSTHTPFKKIHDVCDDLMSEAKEATERRGNSVNWRVLSVEDNPSVKEIIKFEKPLFIDNPPEGEKDNLTFKEYVYMRRFYHGRLSGSHAQQIASKIIDFKNDSEKVSKKVEDWLKKQASTGFEKSYSYILVDPKFRKENGDFICERLATLLELLSISAKTDKGNKKQDG
ncbi:MAG: hypothetical protein HQK96_19750 [Nitrospirae bacterium]|nr:hypothetical protein [Nitrospirota bacterium]